MELHEVTGTRIADYRRRLQEERVAYQGALAQTHNTPIHPVVLATLREVLSLCTQYRPGAEGILAVYQLAQVTMMLEELLAPWGVVATFEELQRRLRALEEA